MLSALPSRIMDYRVTAASPTGELLTLGRILSEVGDYASTTLDRQHLSLTRKCASRLKKVVGELIARKCIQSPEDLYELPESHTEAADLSTMSIRELYDLYRGWPARHNRRKAEGREPDTFYYEGRIVREMMTRKAADREEQLQIDYCVATYHNELDNLSILISLPVTAAPKPSPATAKSNPAADKPDPDSARTYPDRTKSYTPEELAALINRHKNYRDIEEREILLEYIDIALDLLSHTPSPSLAATLTALPKQH